MRILIFCFSCLNAVSNSSKIRDTEMAKYLSEDAIRKLEDIEGHSVYVDRISVNQFIDIFCEDLESSGKEILDVDVDCSNNVIKFKFR